MTEAHSIVWFARGVRWLRILWRLVGPLAAGLVVLGATWLFDGPPHVRLDALRLLYVLLGYGTLYAIAAEILSPVRPELRMVRVSDERAQRLATIVKWVLILALGGELAIHLAESYTSYASIPALLKLVRNVGLILFAWIAVSRTGVLHRLLPEETEHAWQALVSVLIRVVFPLAMLTAIYYVVAVALGYLGLALWTVGNAAMTAVVIVAAVLIYHYAFTTTRDAIQFVYAEREADDETSPVWIGVHRVVALVLKVAIILAAIVAIRGIWDLRDGLVDQWAARGVPFLSGRSWGDILNGAVGVVAVLILGRILRDVLVFIVFPKAHTDVGARYATVTILKYATIAVAVGVGISSLGLDMSAVAVFAGGAGVGLSFALSDILGNFFAGLIMLFEQPVKIGDEIRVGASGGWVEAIRLRGTVIRSYDGTSVIIPNKQMIGERLENRSGDLELFRAEIMVGVAYGSDMEKVQRILLETAKADPRVRDKPAPFVRFSGFGPSSVDFIVRAYTDLVKERWALQSDLAVAIHDAFDLEDIEIPFPQRDVHLKSGPDSPSS